MSKRPRAQKPDHGVGSIFPLDPRAAAVQAIVWEFDKAIAEVEAKWGVDRLPYLVDARKREAWWLGMDQLNQAIREGEPDQVRAAVDNMLLGIAMLVRAAEKAGESPLSPDVWEVALDDGKVLQIIRCWPTNAAPVSKDRNVVTWTLEEVAHLISNTKAVNAIKGQWPGATVEPPRPRSGLSNDLNDEIPF